MISGTTFAATPIDFAVPVPEFNTTAYITATFSELTPASVTGSVDRDGTLTARVNVKVDLHIEVGRPAFLVADCAASPVNLRLTSTGPFDAETGRVTLVDDDFSVPPVPTGGTCISQISSEVNETLAGGGHAIEMTMAGEVHPPVIGTEATTTTLTVTPETTRAGDEVTLTTQVAPAPGAAAGTPAGLVEFADGTTVFGTAPLDESGGATFTTTTLAVGHHQLTARYLGNDTYNRSTSPVAPHLVAAAPTVTIDMADTALIGSFPRPATITVANDAENGAPLQDLRLDFRIGRVNSPSAQLPADRVVVERLDGSTWVPVALTAQGNQTLLGSVPAPGGTLAPGATATIRLRVTFPFIDLGQSDTLCGPPQRTCPGPAELAVTLVEIDGNAELAEAVHPFTIVEATRRDTTLTFLASPRPHTVRQGYGIEFIARIAPTFGGIQPSGVAEILVDGRRIGIRTNTMPFEQGYIDSLPVISSAIQGLILLPPDIEPGTHVVTVRYSGDLIYQPSETTSTFTVVASAGHAFVCRVPAGIGNARNEFGANIVFDAEVPTLAAAGDEVPLDISAARILMNRPFTTNPLTSYNNNATYTVGPESVLKGISFGFGPGGTGTAAGLTRQGATAMLTTPNPAPVSQVDQTITFNAPSGSIVVDGAPGEVVPVTLDEIVIDQVQAGPIPAPYKATCTPVGGSMVLGEVTVAGVAVSASPEGPIREGTDVTIDADVVPADAAGTVAFSSDRDGALGAPVAVDDGSTSLTTGSLSVGVHQISASFNATDPDIPDTTGTVTVVVLPRYDCPTFAQPGNAAVVRLVYLELLGRCPDHAGFDHWKTRLDRGTSPEAFARTIARTPEAVGRVVDDAYTTVLGRSADASGRAYWVNRLQGHSRYDQLLADLASSDEFWTKAGSTHEGFVTRIYQQLLGRTPDQAGLDHWTGRLDAGTSRRTLVLTLATLDEPLRVLVTAAYDEILDRTPTTAERTAGTTFLRRTGDRSGLYAQLIGRPEFATRAGTFPNPDD